MGVWKPGKVLSFNSSTKLELLTAKEKKSCKDKCIPTYIDKSPRHGNILMDPVKESHRSWGSKDFIFGASFREAFREATNKWATLISL